MIASSSSTTDHSETDVASTDLGSPPADAFEHILRLAARVFDVPVVQICLSDAGELTRQSNESGNPEAGAKSSNCFGLDTRHDSHQDQASTRARLFVAPAWGEGTAQVLVVPDAWADAEPGGAQAAGMWRAGLDSALRFYAGVSLRSRNGHVWGSLWLADTQPRDSNRFSEQDVATLSDIAMVVVEEIELWTAGHRTREAVREQARSQEALRASEKRARAIIEAAHDAFVGIDADGFITDWNRRAEETFGWESREVMGQPLASIIIPERYRKAHIAGIRKYLQTGQGPVLNQVIELSAVHRDGHEFPIELSITPLDADPEQLFTAFVRDISERKRVENELVESKRFSERVAEHSTNIIYVFDIATLTSVYANRSMTTFLGYTQEESVGLGPNFLSAIVHPDDLLGLRVHLDKIRALQDDEVIEYEMRFRHANGSWRWLWNRESVFVRDSDGVPTQILGTAQDITERKAATQAVWESQQRFAAFMRHVPGVAFMKDIQGRYTYVNDTFENLFGLSVEDVRGKVDTQLWPPEAAAEFTRNDRHVLENLHAVQAIETVPHEDGPHFWLSSKFPVLDDRGHAVMIGGVSIDITERVHAEQQLKEFTAMLEDRVERRTAELARLNEELRAENERRAEIEVSLRRAKDEAEAANQAKNEFLSRTSHELRTPMNAILGFGQLLELDILQPEQQESVQHILNAGRHLLRLINEVLDIARIEERRLGLHQEPVLVEPALRAACDMMRLEAAQQRVRIVHQNGISTCTHVLADRQKLHQILLNLLSNAVKYNREGGEVLVFCQLEPHLLSAGRASSLRICVRDTGQGIASTRMDELFVPFSRLGAEKTGIEGVGLGLSLSKSLAEAMDGAIVVESTPGIGSTFSLLLPLAPPETPAETHAGAEDAEGPLCHQMLLQQHPKASP
jgi:PAS domain S-box-containing protein